MMTSNPEGCRLCPGLPPLAHSAPYGPGSMQTVCFPPAELIEAERQRQVTRKLLGLVLCEASFAFWLEA